MQHLFFCDTQLIPKGEIHVFESSVFQEGLNGLRDTVRYLASLTLFLTLLSQITLRGRRGNMARLHRIIINLTALLLFGISLT